MFLSIKKSKNKNCANKYKKKLIIKTKLKKLRNKYISRYLISQYGSCMKLYLIIFFK
jgi:hypothetical protein